MNQIEELSRQVKQAELEIRAIKSRMLGVFEGNGISASAIVGTVAGSSGYGLIQDEGIPLTVRTTINFVGAGVTAADSGGVTTVTIAGGGVGTHVILDSAIHTDTLTGTVVDGDTIIGNVTPKWSRLPISIPAVNVRNVLGIDSGELRPSWKVALDGTAPVTQAFGDAASPGTSLIFAHRDHRHGMMAAPADLSAIDFLVGTASALLSAKIVVGTSPGGELGGTWASPTVDATHSGSAHHTRLHAITGTSDHSAGNWKAMYTNGSGQVIELPLGAAGTFYRSAGAAVAPTMAAVTLTTDVTGTLPVANGGTAVTALPSRLLIIPAESFSPTITAGCAPPFRTEISAQHDYWSLDFDGTTKEYAVKKVVMPPDYNGGTFTLIFHWFSATGDNTKDVRWGGQALGLADGTALSTAYGSAVEVTDTCNAAANVNLISAATGAITPGGTAAGGNDMELLIYRDPANAADDLAGDARLTAVHFIYTPTAF